MDFLKALLVSTIPNPDRTVTKCEGYFISYNPITDCGPETALVVEGKENKKFHILLGDHREQYKACKDLAACKKYFSANTHLKSGWSS
jgi:hypothetical protein